MFQSFEKFLNGIIVFIISLLDLLAGRKDPRGCDGLVLSDSYSIPKNFKCMTGYVVQV